MFSKFMIVAFLMLFFKSSFAIDTLELKNEDYGEVYILSNAYVAFFEDRSGSASLEEVVSSKERETSSQELFPSNNDGEYVYLVRFSVKNNSHDELYVFDSHSPNTEKIKLYRVSKSGKVLDCGKTGLGIPIKERKYRDKNLLLDMNAGGFGEEYTYYVRIDKGAFCRFNFFIKPFSYFVHFATLEYYLLGLFYGALLILAIYNLILFLSLRKNVHLWYIAFILSAALKTLSEDRTGGLYLWTDYPRLSYYLGVHIAPNLILLTFIMYSISFLGLKKLEDKKEVLLIVGAAAFHFSYFGIASLIWGDTLYSDLFLFLPFLAISYVTLKKRIEGNFVSWYFVFGTLFFLFTVVISELRHQRILFGGAILVFSFNFSLIIQSVVLSVSIFDRIKNLYKEKESLLIRSLEQEKSHYSDLMRLRYYTDISHELKTHLMLIASPIKKLKQNMGDKEVAYQDVLVADKNANKLIYFVDKVLDIRKMELGYESNNITHGDLVPFTEELIDTFIEYADEKDINLKFETNTAHFLCGFDASKIEKVLFNLVSNAIKYTEMHEQVCIKLFCNLKDNNVRFEVIDAGYGIAQKDIGNIFSRYYQIDRDKGINGYGIGLEFTKRLVDNLNGEIEVESEIGKGTVFTVKLPVELTKLEKKTTRGFVGSNDQLPTVLMVDDNMHLRSYLKNELSDEYNVIEANDGEEALELIQNSPPDLIITDVKMPNMSGIELCNYLKKDENTKHIPIIIQSVKQRRGYVDDGLLVSVNHYLTKPVFIPELKAVISNILSLRKELKTKYRKEVLLSPEVVDLEDASESFIVKVKVIIEENLDDPDFGVETFCVELGISRAQLYRKFSSILNQSVKEYVREFRVQKASQYLKNGDFSVKEVMVKVGFANRQYFIKCFKEHYGEVPSTFK